MNNTKHTPEHTININVKKSDLSALFDGYWDSIKDRLNPDLLPKQAKGDYRAAKRDKVIKNAGGIDVFYRHPLKQIVHEWAASNGKHILIYNGATTDYDSATDNVTVNASIYLEPEIEWASSDDAIPGIKTDLPVTVKLRASVSDLKTEAYAKEMKRLIDSHVTTTKVDKPVSEGMLVGAKVSITDLAAVVPVWREARLIASREEFVDPNIADELIGMKAGGTKTFTIDNKGTKMLMSVEVLDVHTRTIPTLSDVARTFNKTEAELAGLISKRMDAEVQTALDELIIEEAIATLMTHVGSIELPAQMWINEKANLIYNSERNTVATEEDLFNKFKPLVNGEVTKAELIKRFGQAAIDGLNRAIMLRSWGQKKGIALEKIKSVPLSEYVDLITKHITANAKVTHVIG